MGMIGMEHAVRGIWKRYLRLWRDLTGRRLFLLYALHYTAAFLLLSLVIFEPFREAGVSFVCTTDGLPQHFVRLEYISHTLRSGLLALLKGEGWKIPLYDFSAGLMRQDLQIGFPQILAALEIGRAHV